MAHAVAPEAPPVVDDQGKSLYCTRFALSKAIVQACDDFGINVAQDAVSLVLVNEHKDEKQEGKFALAFHNKTYWIKDDCAIWFKTTLSVEETSLKVFRKLWDKKEGAFVLNWRVPNAPPPHNLHCVFAERWMKKEERVKCLNSWKTEDPEPEIQKEAIENMYLVQLKMQNNETKEICKKKECSQTNTDQKDLLGSISKLLASPNATASSEEGSSSDNTSYPCIPNGTETLVIKSNGLSPEWQGNRLGEYQLHSKILGFPVYKQRSTINSDSPAFLFKAQSGEWCISATIDREVSGGLFNPACTPTPPTNGWLVAARGGPVPDPSLSISPGSLVPCRHLRLSYLGPELPSSVAACLGNYESNGQWESGRPAYMGEKGHWLGVWQKFVAWCVRDSQSQGGEKWMHISSACSANCPSEIRNRRSVHRGQSNWIFRRNDGRAQEFPLQITCACHYS